jgi:hypothetical protein
LNSMNSITSKRDENKKRILLWVNLSVLPVSSSNDRFFLLFLIHLCNLTFYYYFFIKVRKMPSKNEPNDNYLGFKSQIRL